MDFTGKTVVVTGGDSGIGAALVERFLTAGARVAVFDLGFAAARQDVLQIVCDVGAEKELIRSIEAVESGLGQIDIYVSNAGVLSAQPGHAASAETEDWARCWAVNVMAHVFAARRLLPRMIARGAGHFVVVASAAGLLNQIGDAAYSATKHAAVSFAESLAITHGEEGIGVSLVCPQYVATPLIGLSEDEAHGPLLTADEVALSAMDAICAGRFLVLPHPQVRDYALARAGDHDRWIKGMQNLRKRALALGGKAGPSQLYKLV